LVIESAEITVHRVRAARLWSRLGFVGFFVGPLALLIAISLDFMSALLIAPGYLAWILPWVVSYVVWFLRAAGRGHVGIDATHVEVEHAGSRRRIAREEIASAYALEGALELVLRSGDVLTFRLEGADAIVRELGFGAGGRRQTIDLAARRRRLLHLPLAFGAYQLASIAAAPLMMMAVAFLAVDRMAFAMPLVLMAVFGVLPFVYRALKRRTRAASIEVGDDGVAITTGKGTTHHARETILGARPLMSGFMLETTLGSVPVTGTMLDERKCQAAVHAILERWSSMPALPARAHAFAREGRTITEWSADLRARIADGGYRDASGITLEDAEAVLESPASPADARLGAAIALAAGGRRARIAELTEPIANPRLRVALEAVADGRDEPEALARAIAAGNLVQTRR
jgi:hypothetical protein